jgi:hypothetical protein
MKNFRLFCSETRVNASANPKCDKGNCDSATGEVRILPVGGDCNAILCHKCFDDEIKWRKRNNTWVHNKQDLPQWQDLKIYNQE